MEKFKKLTREEMKKVSGGDSCLAVCYYLGPTVEVLKCEDMYISDACGIPTPFTCTCGPNNQ